MNREEYISRFKFEILMSVFSIDDLFFYNKIKYKWVSIDKNKEIWVYYHKPSIDKSYDDWRMTNRQINNFRDVVGKEEDEEFGDEFCKQIDRYINVDNWNIDWKDSLVKIEELINE